MAKFSVAAPVIREMNQSSSTLPQGTWVARRIGGNGVISIAWQQISVGKHRAGQDVDVLITDSMVHVYYKDELLKTALRSNSKEVRKKRASVLRKSS